MNVSSSSSGISLLASNLFNKLDTKQKGYLEQSDMQSALNSLSSTTNGSNDVSEVFTQLDADSDGKVTQTELSDGLQTLADALQAQLQQSRMQGMGGMPPPPPPPPGDAGVDEGFTQDQLSTMASDSSDSKRAELMSKLAANFDAADTDGNGKVNRDEAMAYDQSTRTDSITTSTVSAEASSSDVDTLNLKVMVQIMQLLQAYGVSANDTEASSSSALSLSA